MSGWNFKDAPITAKIAVFVDLPDGELTDAGKGSLSEASRLAKTLGCKWSAICFAGAAEAVLENFAPYGTEHIILLEDPDHVSDYPGLQAKYLARAATQHEVGLLMLPHNDLGGALAPLVASEMQSALFTEAIAFSSEGSELHLTRPLLGSQVAETKRWDGKLPLVLTVHTKVLSAVVLPSMKPGNLKIARWQPSSWIADNSLKIIERIPPDPQTVDVAEAEVIVSAGLGCNAETFAQVEELTRLLNASLGVTRPVYDLGFAGFERMVGQTGKTVAPRFYLALGISGSMHHLGGIKDSKRLVTVNIDSKAPMFQNADEGFVADLREVMPRLIERVRLAAGGGA